MLKKRLLILGSVFMMSLTGCGSSIDIDKNILMSDPSTFDSVITNMKKGYKASGTITQVNRYYTDKSYLTLSKTIEDELVNYDFNFVYENKEGEEAYEGINRLIRKVDEDSTTHILLNENLYNDNGAVRMRYLSYANTIDDTEAVSQDGLNNMSWGSNGLQNPFYSISKNDFIDYGNYNYSLNNDKVSLILANMFSTIDTNDFYALPQRNEFVIDENGNAKSLTVYLSPIKDVKTSEDYELSYYEKFIKVVINFSDIATADAKNEVKVEAKKEDNTKLQAILDKMATQNHFRVKRVCNSVIDGVLQDSFETTDLYYDLDRKAIFYSVYDNKKQPNKITSSDLLYVGSGTYSSLSTYACDNDGNWSGAGSALSGYPLAMFLPVFGGKGGIDASIFDYNKEEDLYVLPEKYAKYWVADSCLMSGIQATQPHFFVYVDSVKIKLNEAGDIEWANISIYYDDTFQILTDNYQLTFAYGDEAKLPYGIVENFDWKN